jgi:hypothetical protein
LIFVTLYGSFFEFLTSSGLGGHNFINSIMFLMTFCAPKAKIGGFQVLFGHQKQQNPPFDMACLKCLSVIVAI